MTYQHKNSIPEIKDLSEQRYLMRVQQRLQDNQQKQQNTSSPSYQDMHGLNLNNYQNSLQNHQLYAGYSQKGQSEYIEDFAIDLSQQSPYAHRTNQQRSKTITLINYKEVRNNSLENNQRGPTPPNAQLLQQQHQDTIQREMILKGQQISQNIPQNSSGQSSGIYTGNITSQFLNQPILMQQQHQKQQQSTINKPETQILFQQQQQSSYYQNFISSNSQTIIPSDASPSYKRINNHSLNYNELNIGSRSNSQQGQIDSVNQLRSNSQQNYLDQNFSRSNSQQGHTNPVNTSIGQRNNHFQSYHQPPAISQPQNYFNQTQGTNNLTTNNNNSIETLIDLENKWSDIKKVHQNFQQRSLSNSSSSNSIAANHRPNSSLNVSTNNNLSFVNASGALLDQCNSSKNINTNYSLTTTPQDYKTDKQSNNNNKLIKKVVPLSKINLNSLIQTGTHNLSNNNPSGQNGINGQKQNKMKLNLHGSFQDQVHHPFESQSLPGSTRGHHDSFQCTGNTGTNQSNNSCSNQFYEFDSKPKQNVQNNIKNQDIIQNLNYQYPYQQKYHHSNNLSLDNTLFSHQASQIHMQSMNDIYSGQQQQKQHQQPQTSHSKCLSYQYIKPSQNNTMNIQNDYNAYESNVSLQNSQNNNCMSLNIQQQKNNVSYQIQPTIQYHSRGDSTSKYFVPTSHSISYQPNYFSHNDQYINQQQQASYQNSINQISIQNEIADNQANQKSQSSSFTQLSNLSTANFKPSNTYNQEFLDYTSNQYLQSQYPQNSYSQNQFSQNQVILNGKQSLVQTKKDILDQPKINQELYLSPQNQKGSQVNQEAYRQNLHISPNNLTKQQSQNAASKERQSSNKKSISDINLNKKQTDESGNKNEQNKKKKYSDQQLEYMKQIIPTYQQQQALAQQKGSFDLNSNLSTVNGNNQLDYTPVYENSSLNEIDNHLYMKYNEYKIRQQQQTEIKNTLNTENPKTIPSTTINTQQSCQGINIQQQIQLSSNKRTSNLMNTNNAIQIQKDLCNQQILKNQYYQTESIQDIVKDQRKSSIECNSKVNQQKIIDQENKNPNNSNNYNSNNQGKMIDHQQLLKTKQSLKQSNSQGQNEFQQMQLQIQQQQQQQQQQLYQQLQGYQANLQPIQNSQQKTFSPRVNYKIISENIKKQKSCISQKNEKIIQNNQIEYIIKNPALIYKDIAPSQQSTIQIQQFFPDQSNTSVSKSFIEQKKIQSIQNQEKNVNEMYENKSMNSNNLNIINKKNGKIIELPLKQIVSSKIQPKYQVNTTDSSEDQGIQQTNISAINLKHTNQIIQTFQKTQNEEINKKKLSITQADITKVQITNSKVNQTNSINTSQKLNPQTVPQKTEPEKPYLKRQHSSSTNNGVFDPFKNISNEQQGVKIQQVNSQLNNQNDHQLQQKQVNSLTTQPKIQCMPCNKNLIEAKQQQKKEEITQQQKQQKQKVEVKLDKKDQIQGILQQNNYGLSNQQMKQPSATQGKSASSFIMPNLVFS